MLYVTTRNNAQPQTAFRAFSESRGEDGGLYLPLRLGPLSSEEIAGLKEKSFGEAVAQILNLFFATQLTGWDVEFAVGRYPIRLIPMSHRMVLTEIWHNPDWDFARTIREMSLLVSGGNSDCPGNWGEIAIRIAFLFGIFAELMSSGELEENAGVDVSVASGDFSGPMAAVYARQMGLPIANVVVCCNENSAPWDLICKGELKTGVVPIQTALPACDHGVPEGIERLLYACGGGKAVEEFLARQSRGGVYFPDEETSAAMRAMLQVSVVSSKRVMSSLRNIYKTSGKVLGPYTALTWCGLMDYRARTGESRLSLVLSERGPQVDAGVVSEAMGITAEELNERI